MNFRVCLIGMQGKPVAASVELFDFVDGSEIVGHLVRSGKRFQLYRDTMALKAMASWPPTAFYCSQPKVLIPCQCPSCGPDLLTVSLETVPDCCTGTATVTFKDLEEILDTAKAPERKPAVAAPPPLTVSCYLRYLASLAIAAARDLFFPVRNPKLLDAQCVGK